MFSRKSYVSAIATMLVATVAAHAADRVSPRDAKQAINAMEKSNSSLSKAIQVAENKTGGKAFSVELLAANEVSDIYNRSGYSHREMYSETDSKNRSEANKSNNQDLKNQTEENKELAKQDSKIDPSAAHAKVTCLLNGNRVRCALVNLENNKVVRVRNIGHGDTGTRYGYRSDYGYNQDYYDNRYNGDYSRTNSSDRDRRDDNRYDNRYDGQRAQIDHDYIEQNAWPPTRNERGYQGHDYASSNSDNRYNRSAYRTSSTYHRGSSMNQRGSGLVLASDLTNAKVRNTRGQDLGDISDLAIDPDSKCLVYAAVTHGGFLGIGQKRFAVPSEELTLKNDGCVCINARVEEFNEREGFKADNWPKQAEGYWRTASSDDAMNNNQSKSASEIVKSSDIIDRPVYDNAGNEVGEVEDLVVDPSRGKVAYLLVEVGDGMDEGLVAVPAAAVQHQKDRCVVDVNKSSINSMERFSASNHPNFNSTRWNERMHGEFNVSPYWQDGANQRMQSRTQSGG